MKTILPQSKIPKKFSQILKDNLRWKHFIDTSKISEVGVRKNGGSPESPNFWGEILDKRSGNKKKWKWEMSNEERKWINQTNFSNTVSSLVNYRTTFTGRRNHKPMLRFPPKQTDFKIKSFWRGPDKIDHNHIMFNDPQFKKQWYLVCSTMFKPFISVCLHSLKQPNSATT